MPIEVAPWACGVFSAMAACVLGLYQLLPGATPYLNLVGVAVLLWLSSTGVYHKSKDAGEWVRDATR